MTDNIRINTFENFILKSGENFSRKTVSPLDKKVGWFCTYTPEEIITAAGFVPVRITGQEKAKKAEGYFPINFCPFIKSAMEDLLSFVESEDKISALIFTNSCDGMRRFYDICRSYLPDMPAFMLDVPRIKNSLSLIQFSNNIGKMAAFLTGIGSKSIDTDTVKASVKLHEEKRILLAALTSLFKKYQGAIGINNYFNIIKNAMTSEPGHFTMQLGNYLKYTEAEMDALHAKNENIPGYKNTVASGSPPVMIIGNFIDEVKLWEIMDDLGCSINAVDTCNGERYFESINNHIQAVNIPEGQAENYGIQNGKIDAAAGKLITGIALRHLFKPQCMRMSDLGAKISEINENISKNKIKGVIFISQKFCDNTLLFYPLLRDNLNILKVPSLFLEIEHNNLSSGQIKTRIQAFLEII